MDPERWQLISRIFNAALARDEATRHEYVDEACAGDAALKAEVQAMLDGDAAAAQQGDPLTSSGPRVQTGASLGPYRVEQLLGAGGMGEVYRARDTRLNRTVAIKVLPAGLQNDAGLRRRFEREAQAVAALNHANICTLHDIGQHEGIDFLVMEYLDGETLERRLKSGALPLEQALSIAIQIADALDKAHRAGIVHRDLKPGNVMLTKAGVRCSTSASPNSRRRRTAH
jgi:serine/threonine protein kinase